MRRRSFLHSLAGSAAVTLAPEFALGRPGRLRISGVELWRLEGERKTLEGANRQHQVQPLHVYEAHRPAPYREPRDPREGTARVSAIYLKILTTEGVEGLYGPVDIEAAVVVGRQVGRFLEGKDPLAGETLWDQLFRSNRHSRSSHYMMAISALDNALWDLRGRYFEAPVYRLLGGPTQDPVEAYGSALGFSVEPEPLQARARELKKQGYRHQKWFMAYGPGDGPEGLRKNVEMVPNLREAVGEDVDLMFDAFMGWDLNYAIAWAKQVERYRPRWIEEAFHPDKLESFVELSRATSVPVATGEHFYNRWEVERFLNARAIRVVQADPEWCGGVSELVKICAIASAHDVQVVPHGHSLHAALHVVASQSPMTCPLVEYLINKMAYYYWFEKHQLPPVQGRIALPDRPGFGIELDEAKILKRERLSFG
jgi:L-rhamnonate dehydratase